MGRRDESEFAAFAEACRPALRRTAYLMCGDWERAADITQEAMIRVYVAWPRLEQDHGLRAYARRAVVSVAIEQARKRSSREVPTADLGDRLVEDAADHVVDRLLLMTALAELPARQRACVVLRYYEDLSVEAVAEALGCRTGTVKSQTARGLEALRAAYARHGGELLVRPGMPGRGEGGHAMSTELHAALREAVADAPFDESDLRAVIDAGSRRLRRRAALRVGASACGGGRRGRFGGRQFRPFRPGAPSGRRGAPRPQPGPDQDLDVLASVRTTWRDPGTSSTTTASRA